MRRRKTRSLVQTTFYDSRAWQTGYTLSPANVKTSAYALLMRNQLPPIVDIALVCLDPTSVVRLNLSNQSTPPAVLQPAAGLFTNSANLDTDLNAYGQQLTASRIRFPGFPVCGADPGGCLGQRMTTRRPHCSCQSSSST